ncbi:hypothetical protein DFH07DRAFT_496445 [Mycena maculata]|uniref:Uncharacterized protein n=1 Tax=Mycena maculata TaxID=230809 RepID=A0AAD7J4M3_9AGAR|nr:hypothetical protein DFH07DRAFT_496445 [Mycena maculata]
MKISSSSSLLFALAISSSSSSLAAPAGDPLNSEASMTSSPSGHHVAARRDSTAGRGLRPSNMQEAIESARSIDTDDLDARGGLLDGLPLGLPAALCGLTKLLVTCPVPDGKQAMMEAESNAPMSRAQAMQMLQEAMVALQDGSSSYTPSDDGDSDDNDNDADDSARKDDSDDSFNNGTWNAPAGASSGGDSSSGDPSSPKDDSNSTAAAADYDSAAASPSLSRNPPNTPKMSSTTASAEPTDPPARRDGLPVPVPSLVPVLPVPGAAVPATVPDITMPVTFDLPVSVGDVLDRAADDAEVPRADGNVQAPFPLRRWSRAVPRQVPAQVPPPPGLATGVLPVVNGVATDAPVTSPTGVPIVVVGTATSLALANATPAAGMGASLALGSAAPAEGKATSLTIGNAPPVAGTATSLILGNATPMASPVVGVAPTSLVEGVVGSGSGTAKSDAPAAGAPAVGTVGNGAGMADKTAGSAAGGAAPAFVLSPVGVVAKDA